MADNEQITTVDLTGSTFRHTITESWLGKDVSSILDVNNISKVILLHAMTSAPTSIDISNILLSIEKATKFEPHTQGSIEHVIWHALLLTKQGEYIRYIADGEWIHITLESGGGSFRWHREELW